MEENEEKKQGCYLFVVPSSLIVIMLTKWIFPDVIPFGWFEFWRWGTDGFNHTCKVILNFWPIFAWAIGVNIFFMIKDWRYRDTGNASVSDALTRGFVISAFAGIFEEICFRWLFFYSAIVSLTLVNYMFFDWAGFGITEFLYNNVVGKVANFTTLKQLEEFLFGELGWAVGAAIIVSNGKFRDGHSYQGFFGLVNSWFLGMVFFYIMFNYGLLLAILIHFLYDFVIFLTVSVEVFVKSRRTTVF